MEFVSDIGEGLVWWVTSLPLGEWLASLIALGCVLLLVRNDVEASEAMSMSLFQVYHLLIFFRYKIGLISHIVR